MYIFIHANLGIYCKYQEQVFAAIPRERIEDMLTEFENSKDLLPFAVLNPFLDILRTSGHLRPKIAPLFSRIADEIDRNKVPLPSNTIFFFLILTKRKTTLTPLTGESSCIDPIMDTYTRQNNCRGKGNCSFLVGAWTRGQCR